MMYFVFSAQNQYFQAFLTPAFESKKPVTLAVFLIKKLLNFKLFKMLTTIIVITLIFGSTSAQNCSPSASLDQISTGTYSFSLQPFTARLQCFNVSLDSYYGNNKPQVAVGINGISNFQSDSLGLDFSLRNLLSAANTQLSLILIVNNGTWGSVTVSYLISARQQFVLGNALSNGNLLASCTKQQSYPISFNLPSSQALPNSQSLGVLILLSGLRTPSSLFTLQFTLPSLDLTLKQINTSINTNATNQIQLIQIYYVIVDLAKFSNNRYTYSFNLNPTPSDFSLGGLVSINAQTLQIAFFAINRTAKLTCVGFDCSGCQTADSCTSLGGQATATQCIKCTSNQIFVNGACVCTQGFNLINGTCRSCPPGTLFSSLLNTCSNICTVNQIWSSGSCVCVQGYTLVNGQCQPQPQCASNFFNLSGVCYPCPGNSTSSPDKKGCVCNAGFTYIPANSSCILPLQQQSTGSSSSTSSSSSGFYSGSSASSNGIYSLPSSSSTSTTTTNISANAANSGNTGTSSSNTGTNTASSGSFYGINTVINTNPTTYSCPTGAYYKNLTCRSQATISIFNIAKLATIPNVVYAGIVVSSLPDTLPNNSSSSLIIAKLTNSPPNTAVSISLSTYNESMWIASINYTDPFAPISLVLSWNPSFSYSFTAAELSYALTTVIIPSQVSTYSIATSATNSLSNSGDVLTPDESQQISSILNSQK